MARHVFLTGPPGIGKTTLIQKASEILKSSGVPVDGFYTEEVRQGGKRIGFDVVTLSGLRGPLSRVGSGSPPGKQECQVGQYMVDLAAFEQLALPVLNVPAAARSQECVSLMRLGKWSSSASLSFRPFGRLCPPPGLSSWARSQSGKENRWPLWKKYETDPTFRCSVSPRKTETTSCWMLWRMCRAAVSEGTCVPTSLREDTWPSRSSRSAPCCWARACGLPEPVACSTDA
ncbi:cancer-related nucleoside-triphosphatase isoform X1 [Saccopteryx bilineata]|uniref:cancer-related nucleoside-triphosphatase isoform X1 n=1 Tax=Saccopteryx bilineata TaxID=59482 RepID=UPI00338F34E1